MVTSFGFVIIFGALLCFLNRIYLRDDSDNSFVSALLQIQGWLGLSICLWGVWEVIYAQLEFGKLTSDFFYWLNILLGGLMNVFTGGLLGFGMIQRSTIGQVASEGHDAAVKLRFSLILLQVRVSYVAGLMGSWFLIYSLTLK